MFIIHNLTNKTIVLSDLRVEIGPRRLLNLERVAERSAIDNSRDLKRALAERQLALTRHSIIETNQVPDREVKRNIHEGLSEEQLSRLIRKAVSEELGERKSAKEEPTHQPNIEETIQKAIVSNMGGLIDSIRQEINSVHVDPKKKEEMSIDPEKFAEMSQKSIDKISNEIQTGGQKKGKSVKIINKKSASDLANELE